MIIGIGTDLVEVSRIEQVWQRQGVAFAKRILAEAEWPSFEACAEHPVQRLRLLAKRWAYKEAMSKALGTGMAQGIGFGQMWLEHDALGKPLAMLAGAAAARCEALGITDWQVSISDERHYAVAFVIGQRF